MASQIEKVQQGDRHAILEFYRTFAPRIQKYLRRKLPRHEDAQEILNDVFLDALDELPFLKNTQNISAWLFRIAHNKMVDFYRKRKLRSILFSQLPYLELVATQMTEPEFIMEKERVREKIEQALNKLSEKYRQILHLHYEEGIKVKDLAVIFNLSFKATESLLFRARIRFQEQYGRA